MMIDFTPQELAAMGTVTLAVGALAPRALRIIVDAAAKLFPGALARQNGHISARPLSTDGERVLTVREHKEICHEKMGAIISQLQTGNDRFERVEKKIEALGEKVIDRVAELHGRVTALERGQP
jgi:hypothetical protein